MGAPERLPSYAAMMADPLNAEVVGKPDYNAAMTNVSRFRDVYDVTTTATGKAAIRICPSTAYAINIAPNVDAAGVPINWPVPSASDYHASMASDNAQYRTLCYVVQWTPTLSDMNAAGKIFLGEYARGAQDTPAQDYSKYFDDEGLTSSAKDSACIVCRPMGDLPFGNVDVDIARSTFGTVVVVITGMPSVSQVVGAITVTRIVELIPYGTTLARSQAKHSPCDIHDCCVAANIVGPGATRSGGPDPYDKIVRSALKIARTAHRVFTAYSSSGASELARLIGS